MTYVVKIGRMTLLVSSCGHACVQSAEGPDTKIAVTAYNLTATPEKGHCQYCRKEVSTCPTCIARERRWP